MLPLGVVLFAPASTGSIAAAGVASGAWASPARCIPSGAPSTATAPPPSRSCRSASRLLLAALIVVGGSRSGARRGDRRGRRRWGCSLRRSARRRGRHGRSGSAPRRSSSAPTPPTARSRSWPASHRTVAGRRARGGGFRLQPRSRGRRRDPGGGRGDGELRRSPAGDRASAAGRGRRVSESGRPRATPGARDRVAARRRRRAGRAGGQRARVRPGERVLCRLRAAADALLSVGSVVGGLWYGAPQLHPATVETRYLVLTASSCSRS